MKPTLSLLLSFFVTLGFSQTAPPVVVKAPLSLTSSRLVTKPILKLGALTIKDKSLYVGSTKVRFHVATLTDGACFQNDPVAFATMLKSRGYNAVRLHHCDRLIRENPALVAKGVAFLDALYALGMRASIDLVSKRGETWSTGVDGYKLDLYMNRNSARADLTDYVNLIKPILNHPALWCVCLVNEGATILRNNNSAAGAQAYAKAFYDWGSTLVRSLGYKGFLTDLPDGFVDPVTFGEVAKGFDIVTMHFYGGHPDEGNKKFFLNSWPLEGWNIGTAQYYVNIAGRPVYVQEWGCLPFNPKRGANEAFLAAEMFKRGYVAEAQFCFASNLDFAAGKFSKVDWYNLVTDRQRSVSALFAAYVNQYGGADTDYFFGHYATPQKQSSSYRWACAKISLSVTDGSAKAVVSATATKAFVFLWDQTAIKGYDDQPIGEQRQVVSYGGTQQASFSPGMVSVKDGYRVTSAYEIDPATGERISECIVSDGAFLPVSGCGVWEVNVRRK